VVGLSNFSRLEILDLSYNFFIRSISQYIEALSSLKAISLAYNQLNDTFPKRKNRLENQVFANCFFFFFISKRLQIVSLTYLIH
jgi:Leucine-rich repeat (LRR) protein